MPSSRGLARWFDAAKAGDADYVVHCRNSYLRCVDQRKTNVDAQTFNGFAAIHYCSYFNHCKLLKYLVLDEVSLMTSNREDIPINTPGTSPEARLPIQPRSSALSVAVLRNSAECVEYILSYIKYNADLLIRSQVMLDRSRTPELVVAALCGCEPVLRSRFFLENQFVNTFRYEPRNIVLCAFQCEHTVTLDYLIKYLAVQQLQPHVIGTLVRALRNGLKGAVRRQNQPYFVYLIRHAAEIVQGAPGDYRQDDMNLLVEHAQQVHVGYSFG